jgi:hypothetical protein
MTELGQRWERDQAGGLGLFQISDFEWLIEEVKQLREARDRLKAEYDRAAAEVMRLQREVNLVRERHARETTEKPS